MVRLVLPVKGFTQAMPEDGPATPFLPAKISALIF